MDPKPYLDAMLIIIPNGNSPSLHLEHSLKDGEIVTTYKAFVFTDKSKFSLGACHIGTGDSPQEAILRLAENVKKDLAKATVTEPPPLRAVES